MSKPMTQRQVRVSHLLQEQIAAVLTRGTHSHNDMLPYISISEVWVSPDLQNARVYFTCLQKVDDIKELTQSLNAEAPEIRKEMSRGLNLKYTPKVKFVYDESFDAANRMDNIFKSNG